VSSHVQVLKSIHETQGFVHFQVDEVQVARCYDVE